MNDFITPEQLSLFGVAVAAVIAATNAGARLFGQTQGVKWVALIAAIGATVAGHGLPHTLGAGIALAFNALFVYLAALGGNTAVVDGLAGRHAPPPAPPQPPTRALFSATTTPAAAEPQPARFWRKW